ncbi:hypothetical protein ACHAW5_007421 [Stephanodiscus triporus]|uniref:Uncharacterized protein n=1 Tax=Stephanodiscus triporus TaxID=2934178 RepID=A0ABD3P795_9STRA
MGLSEIINIAQYPIDGERGKSNPNDYEKLLQSSIFQLDLRGFVSLSNFLRPDAMDKLTSCIMDLERRGAGFYSNDSHNVFLEEVEDDSGSSMSSSSSMNHPRNVRLNSSKLILNAKRPRSARVRIERYVRVSCEFLDFRQFHPWIPNYTPPMIRTENTTRMYSVRGDGLQWHLDRSEYSVSLMLRPGAGSEGKFQFVRNSRRVVEGWDEIPRDVPRAFVEASMVVEEPDIRRGRHVRLSGTGFPPSGVRDRGGNADQRHTYVQYQAGRSAEWLHA